VSLRLSTQVTSQGLALGQSIEGSLLNAVCELVELHVSQHHDRAKEQRGRVGKGLAGNVGSGSVDSLEDGALITDVSGGSKSKTTNEACAHVGQNVAVEVGHNKDFVVVRSGVRNNLQAGVVEELGVEFDFREVFRDPAGGAKEETIAHLHDRSLVDGTDLWSVDGFRILESEAQHTLTCLSCDKLDALHDTVNDDVLDTRVFTFGVFSDQNCVDVVIRRLVASDRSAGSDVGKEVESTAESKVQRNVAFADGSLYCLRGASYSVSASHTARGPFNATLFLSMLSIVSSGMVVFPSFN
jgi:hypothetical protein